MKDYPRVGFIVTNLRRRAKGVVRFHNLRGTAEQWIKEGKNAVNWTRLSSHYFVDNQVRLQLFVLAYNMGNFLFEKNGVPSQRRKRGLSMLAKGGTVTADWGDRL